MSKRASWWLLLAPGLLSFFAVMTAADIIGAHAGRAAWDAGSLVLWLVILRDEVSTSTYRQLCEKALDGWGACIADLSEAHRILARETTR